MTDCQNTTPAAANSGKSVMVVYLDMTKASDNMPHRRPINEVKLHEIPDPAH